MKIQIIYEVGTKGVDMYYNIYVNGNYHESSMTLAEAERKLECIIRLQTIKPQIIKEIEL